MKVTLIQEINCIIELRIEDDNTCIQISTSCNFDPYQELYIWLGKIKYNQLPVTLSVDEEGRGVLLTAKENNSKNIEFSIKFWGHKCKPKTYINPNISNQELVTAFCIGIIDFVTDEFCTFNWLRSNEINSINWRSLLKLNKEKIPNWDKRLLMHYARGGKEFLHKFPELQSIFGSWTTEEKWLCRLKGILYPHYDASLYHKALFNLYRNLPIDIALGEIDRGWYQEQEERIKKEYTKYSSNNTSHQTLMRRKISQQKARLQTLKIGQIVDGTILFIKDYGVAIDIGGINALLKTNNISHVSVNHPQDIFCVGDWVRGIIIDIDINKGRVSLSTKNLEIEAGDMLKNPLQVYEAAKNNIDI